MIKVQTCIATMLTALIALMVVPTTQSEVQTLIPRLWEVSNSSTVEVGTPYELHNKQRERLGLSTQLGYKKVERRLAADVDDVGWVGNSGGHFEFRRPNPRDHRAIKRDENLALYNTKIRKYMTGEQVQWEGRTQWFQVWSSSPTYEWQLHGLTGAAFALYNVKHNDYMPGSTPHGPLYGSVSSQVSAKSVYRRVLPTVMARSLCKIIKSNLTTHGCETLRERFRPKR